MLCLLGSSLYCHSWSTQKLNISVMSSSSASWMVDPLQHRGQVTVHRSDRIESIKQTTSVTDLLRMMNYLASNSTGIEMGGACKRHYDEHKNTITREYKRTNETLLACLRTNTQQTKLNEANELTMARYLGATVAMQQAGWRTNKPIIFFIDFVQQ